MFSIVRYMMVFQPSPAITVNTLRRACHDRDGPTAHTDKRGIEMVNVGVAGSLDT